VAGTGGVPDGTKIESIQVPFNKGDSVACYLTELVSSKGQVSARGRLEKLSPSPGKSNPVGGAPSGR